MQETVRLDYKLILDTIEKDSKVLDLGCGDGELLRLLRENRSVRGTGIEKDEKMVYKCVSKGVTVEHSDINNGLSDFPDSFFDYVILNFTLQQTKKPKEVIREALRVGKTAIVSFPNFAFYSVRYSLGIRGRTPLTKALPYRWDVTPNLHYFTIKDFTDFCKSESIAIKNFIGFTDDSKIALFPNFFAEQAIFILKK